ncbi:Hypothetical protein FKW44_016807 [Caligus rogercresseyi]|uniref:Uncharacterized protein n=1 Tax=Caligus rogercresseyi TaxID=217165 RepID=A0A7T8H291_CALRO|nr:Hypothetical protein FKW44_016807 [Caligus rogercresseyi]
MVDVFQAKDIFNRPEASFLENGPWNLNFDYWIPYQRPAYTDLLPVGFKDLLWEVPKLVPWSVERWVGRTLVIARAQCWDGQTFGP